MSILAAVDSTGYKIVLFLHIAVAVVAFAPAFMTFYLSRAAKAGDKPAGESAPGTSAPAPSPAAAPAPAPAPAAPSSTGSTPTQG